VAKKFSFEKVAAFLDAIPPYTKQILPRHAEILAQTLRSQVSERYRSFDGSPSGFGLEVLRYGKEKGKLSGRPAKKPVLLPGGIMSMIASNIEMRKLGRRSFRVHVAQSAKHPHGTLRFPRGVPLWLIAYMQESRRPVAMNMTHLMRAYIIMLREGRGGYGTRKTKRFIQRNFPTGTTFVVTPPDRPVWSFVIQRRLPKLLILTAQAISVDLVKLAVKYGGKPMQI